MDHTIDNLQQGAISYVHYIQAVLHCNRYENFQQRISVNRLHHPKSYHRKVHSIIGRQWPNEDNVYTLPHLSTF